MPLLKLRTSPAPVRQVVLLPDEAFFVRNVPIVTGEQAAPVASQLELALEALSPFPLAQLYYGFWTKPGVDHALVFGAYRRRFLPEETEQWANAELVLPRFALLWGAPPPTGGTTWVLDGADALTVMYFADGSGVPAIVRSEALPAGAEPPDRAAARERLLRGLPGSRAIIDIPSLEVVPGQPGDPAYAARGADLRAELPVAEAERLDVRDKVELTSRRRARARDRWMWRGLLLGAVMLALCAAAELALIGLEAWQGVRLAQVARQTPVVAEITTAHTLATRIEEMSGRRMRPIQMINFVDGPRPATIQFISTTTNGLYTLDVQAQTTSPSDLEQYRSALAALPETRTVRFEVQGTRNNVTTFRMTVTFEPNAFSGEEEVSS